MGVLNRESIVFHLGLFYFHDLLTILKPGRAVNKWLPQRNFHYLNDFIVAIRLYYN